MNTTTEMDANPSPTAHPTRIRLATAAHALLSGALLAASGLALTTDASAAGETTVVSLDSAGAPAYGWFPNLSPDGRFVVFNSGDRLVPNDTNNATDVYLYDRQTQQTTRVSVNSDGGQEPGFFGSQLAAISNDARCVAFESNSAHLSPGDKNRSWDIFVRDRQPRLTTRVSVDSAGNSANSSSHGAAISANGRFVAFRSTATNLVPGDTNGASDIFVHDRQTRETSRVSVDSAGYQGNGSSGGEGFLSADEAEISANGRFVAFSSQAGNLVPGDTNRSQDVFVHDRVTHRTTRVSVDSAGNQGNSKSGEVALSGDGRFVAFTSLSDNLVPGDSRVPGTYKGFDIFVHDRETRRTTKVSVDPFGNQLENSAFDPGLSADGRFVRFVSSATNVLSVEDRNGSNDIFVRDRQTGQTVRVSIDTQGREARGDSGYPAISGDGRFVVFESSAENLIPGGATLPALYVHDRLLDRSASADLAISQTVNPSPFPASSPVTFTLSAVNNGPDPAGEVTLVDGPLGGQAVTSQGTCSNGAPLVCYLGTLAAGARATVTLTLPPRGTGTPRVYNAAQVSAAPLDPNLVNNKTALHATAAP